MLPDFYQDKHFQNVWGGNTKKKKDLHKTQIQNTGLISNEIKKTTSLLVITPLKRNKCVFPLC